MSEQRTYDVEVYEGGRWILLGGYQTATQAIAVAKAEGGSRRRARVRGDRWDETRQVYVGQIVFEYDPATASSYKERYLKK